MRAARAVSRRQPFRNRHTKRAKSREAVARWKKQPLGGTAVCCYGPSGRLFKTAIMTGALHEPDRRQTFVRLQITYRVLEQAVSCNLNATCERIEASKRRKPAGHFESVYKVQARGCAAKRDEANRATIYSNR